VFDIPTNKTDKKVSNDPFEIIDPNGFKTMWIVDPEENPKPNTSSPFIYNIIKNDSENKVYSYEKVDGYHILNHIPPEKIHKGKEDWPVKYSFNNYLFRCDHFTKDHDGLHILFGGCSNTEGVGSNIEDNWSYLLYKDISSHVKTSGFFSIAKGGYGWQQIFSNFKVYVEKFGAPDYYFVLHPNLLRYYTWDHETNKWMYVQRNIGDMSNKELYEEHRLRFPDWATAMSLFIAYCESVGTKIIWTTWDKTESINIKKSGYFDSTFFETYSATAESIKSVRPNSELERDDINFRDGHPGKIQQILWFRSFKDQLIKRKEIFS